MSTSFSFNSRALSRALALVLALLVVLTLTTFVLASAGLADDDCDDSRLTGLISDDDCCDDDDRVITPAPADDDDECPPPTTTTTQPPVTTTQPPVTTTQPPVTTTQPPVTTTQPPTQVLGTAIVGDYVWEDADEDGVADPGEDGIEGATIRLTNTDTDAVVETTTNVDGMYLFSALIEGNYKVELLMGSVSGALTTQASFSFFIADGASVMNADFGLVEILPVTGINADSVAWGGIAFLGFGLLLILGSRRKPEHN